MFGQACKQTLIQLRDVELDKQNDREWGDCRPAEFIFYAIRSNDRNWVYSVKKLEVVRTDANFR